MRPRRRHFFPAGQKPVRVPFAQFSQTPTRGGCGVRRCEQANAGNDRARHCRGWLAAGGFLSFKPAAHAGTGTISVDGRKVAEGRIARTQGFAFSADEWADVGRAAGTPVTEDYLGCDKFNGKIRIVTVELK
jgi:hypothetical protein